MQCSLVEQIAATYAQCSLVAFNVFTTKNPITGKSSAFNIGGQNSAKVIFMLAFGLMRKKSVCASPQKQKGRAANILLPETNNFVHEMKSRKIRTKFICYSPVFHRDSE